jgi:serine/threonine-protein kinase
MSTDPHADTISADEASVTGPAIVGARYELIALLGAGGMGNVYKARDRELDELVALKVLRPEIAGAPGAIERFRRELKLARRVTHPNVARVFDIGELGPDKILTMELVVGESLAALLEREGALSAARAVEIASAICAGVAAAHAAGVVHRDLKPDNVLLGSDGRVVVTDFGIARAAAAEAGKTAGGFVGTPAYMAPEQVEAAAVIDHRADIYALGEILYEMLTGERAWPGESVLAVVAARLTRPPPDARTKRPHVDASLAQLALECMAKSAGERPASMQAIATELARITLPTSATVPPPRSPSHAPPPRPAKDAPGAHKRVAVLPFRNMGPPTDDYVADGLTEDLIDLLSVSRGLRVRSRGVVMGHKGSDRDTRDIGRELDVDVVVEGSVRRAPGAIRIAARLVSVADGFQVWARRFDGVDAELLVLNERVAQAVAQALTVDIEGESRGAADPEAVDLYLRAREAHLAYFGTRDTAAKLFSTALEHSPDDPRVLAGYVMAHARPTTGATDVAALRVTAERALRLAPTLADAHVALAAVLFQLNDVASAVAPLLRALRLAPNHADAHDLLGRLLLEADDPAGVPHVEAAMALEPKMGLPRSALSRHVMLAGDVERAEEILDGASDPSTLPGIRSRYVLWTNDRARAKELLAHFGPDTARGMSRIIRMLLEVVANGTRVTDMGFDALGIRAPRWVACMGQLRAECACAVGDTDLAMQAMTAADEATIYDVAWADRCPVLAPLRKHDAWPEIRDRIAARAASASKAYAAGI